MTKRELKRTLKDLTHCTIQHDGWPCGTCFGALLTTRGIQDNDNLSLRSDKRSLYWQSLLVYRGDYDITGMDYTELEIKQGIKELKEVLSAL